jgi:LuxR family maltose regulon positive regulatory protein
MSEAVALAEPQGHQRTFIEAGPVAHRVLRRLLDADPTPTVRRLVDGCDQDGASTASVRDPGLSPRELLVLGYLPSRLTNAEIADALYVSLNTVKTHLRRIYKRLGVTSRRQAVEAGERLGLL